MSKQAEHGDDWGACCSTGCATSTPHTCKACQSAELDCFRYLLSRFLLLVPLPSTSPPLDGSNVGGEDRVTMSLEEFERGLTAFSKTVSGSPAAVLRSCLLICTRCSSAQFPIFCDTQLGEVNPGGLLVDETQGERLWPTFFHWVDCAGASTNSVMCLDLRLSMKELENGFKMIQKTPLGVWTSFRYPEHGLRAVRQNPGTVNSLGLIQPLSPQVIATTPKH